MRMRHKPNLDARMEKCAEFLINDPEKLKGRWKDEFSAFSRIELEIGCGKGRFTVETAKNQPDVLIVAIEKVPDAMVIAMERVKNEGLNNIRFIDFDAAKLADIFDCGEFSCIYINFCDPWPKSRDAKFRLTAPGFLRTYASLLDSGSEIRFKTDNTPLFDWSVQQFTAEGWALHDVTHDLHANGPVGVMTDYEAKFYAEGMRINRLVAEKTGDTKDSSAGAVPRLRNAALADARGYSESREAAQ